MELTDIAELVQPSEAKILLFVLDGLGGLPREPGGLTELESAHTPNMDRLAKEGSCGLHEPVGAGITPGSGPGHLAVFGYDPRRYRIGRGVLEALGVNVAIEPTEVAARGNFCTVDAEGRVVDRRAGRISTEECVRLCELLTGIPVEGGSVSVVPVKEHRFLLVVRPEGSAGAEVADTDPGREGLLPTEAVGSNAASEPVARLVRGWIGLARERLADEERANMVVLRGFSTLPEWPRFPDVFGMRSFAAAAYPMYRGVARLVGMEATQVGEEPEALAAELEKRIGQYDFFFLHLKGTDKAGEDGDFDRKVAVIEAADALVPRLLQAGPDVVLITGDHSTPATMRSHSWHPVPFLMYGGAGRTGGAEAFGERQCAAGSLGLRRGCELMPLAAARAGRLAKFGA